MRFPQAIISDAFSRSGGSCQRCAVRLDPYNEGKPGWAQWHANHRNRSKGHILSNCEILCVPCHVNTRSYGRPL